MKATATIQGAVCEVRITRDLSDNYAVEVLPAGARRRVPNVRVAPLYLYKLTAENWQAAAWTVLEELKKEGKIQAFECEPVPPKPAKAGAAPAEKTE